MMAIDEVTTVEPGLEEAASELERVAVVELVLEGVSPSETGLEGVTATGLNGTVSGLGLEEETVTELAFETAEEATSMGVTVDEVGLPTAKPGRWGETATAGLGVVTVDEADLEGEAAEDADFGGVSVTVSFTAA